MPITIRQQLAPFWWRLNDKDPDSAEFHIRPLNQLQLGALRNEIGMNKLKRFVMTAEGVEQALAHGLIEWRGVVDESGKPLPCTARNYSMLPDDAISSLAAKIFNISQLSDEQKKS